MSCFYCFYLDTTDQHHTSTTPLAPLESTDKVSLIRAEASSKFTSAKYVVDGFEVPLVANNRDGTAASGGGKPAEANLYSSALDSTSENKLRTAPSQFLTGTEKPSSSGVRSNSNDNSTFLEISNLGSSSTTDHKNKNFQRRNDFEYWPSSISFPNQQLPSQQTSRTYFRHRPQSELMLTNLNPYMGQPVVNKGEPYYVYDSSPPVQSPPMSPYRSRYQHRYSEQSSRPEAIPEISMGSTTPNGQPVAANKPSRGVSLKEQPAIYTLRNPDFVEPRPIKTG